MPVTKIVLSDKHLSMLFLLSKVTSKVKAVTTVFDKCAGKLDKIGDLTVGKMIILYLGKRPNSILQFFFFHHRLYNLLWKELGTLLLCPDRCIQRLTERHF